MAIVGEVDESVSSRGYSLRSGASLGMRWVMECMVGSQSMLPSAVSNGMVRSLARARPNCVSQGQRWGRCRVRL